jgi:hypothetical protein
VTRGETLPLPEGALEIVMKRYGKVLDFPSAPDAGEWLVLDGDRKILRFRFRPRFDVIARDYIALFVPGEDTLCELATSVTAALEHLARIASSRAGDE